MKNNIKSEAVGKRAKTHEILRKSVEHCTLSLSALNSRVQFPCWPTKGFKKSGSKSHKKSGFFLSGSKKPVIKLNFVSFFSNQVSGIFILRSISTKRSNERLALFLFLELLHVRFVRLCFLEKNFFEPVGCFFEREER